MDLEFSGVVAEYVQLVRTHATLFFGTTIAVAALYVVLDLLPIKSAGNSSGIVIGIFGQYQFIMAMMSDYGTINKGNKPRYGALFVASILGGLGIILGTVLLILPGIYLMARWSLSSPFVVEQGIGGTAALKASWRATASAGWTLFFVFIAYFSVIALAFGSIGAVAGASGWSMASLSMSIILNLMVSTAIVSSWVLAVAIYRRVKPPLSGLVEVFS